MRIRSIRALAAAVRGRRLELHLTQAALAERAGVSRKWVYEFEGGKPSAELRLILRVLDALDLALDVVECDGGASAVRGKPGGLDAVIEEHRVV